MRKILVLHGPNLNLLGKREPGIYGHEDLAAINGRLVRLGQELGVVVETMQSNHEGALIDAIQAARNDCSGIVINAAALTHTSVAIADALTAIQLPFVEIHISNVYAREVFRHHSTLSASAAGIVIGLGVQGYVLALRGLVGKLKDN